MVTGEEHARRALRAASVVAGARTLVIQADHEVTEVKQLLEEATSGSANDLALSALRAIWTAEDVLEEARTLLQRSADEADAYVGQVAPGLRRARSVAPSPVPGDQLVQPRPRRRSLRNSLDKGVEAGGDLPDAVRPMDNALTLAKHIDRPPTKTGTSTSQPGPQVQATSSPLSQADALTATVTSVVLLAKGAQLAFDRMQREWRTWRRRRP
jgi:hypothetical protein